MKSSKAELVELREAVFARDGYRCKWPGCTSMVAPALDDFGPLQMAHLTHRGMGGSVEANRLENVVTLCRRHHDCLDGRTGLGTLRYELNEMLRAQI